MYGEKYTYDEFVHERLIEGIIYTIPDKPKRSTIDGYNQPKHLQKWTPIEVPPDKEILSWPKAEQDVFIDKEWDKRLNGHWFYNNGYLEYVTGPHYFYLTYWKFKISFGGIKRLGLPFFIDSDRDKFYHWQACVEDDNCFGELELTKRRDGKSERALCLLYEVTSRTPESRGGIQSKNKDDGKDLFERLIKGWEGLPFYWRPMDSGEKHPVTRLEFREPSSRDTKNQRKTYHKVLRSEIFYGSAKDVEFDGDGLLYYLGDEVFKTDPKEANIYKRWYIVKETLADDAIITGKAQLTSTVEEITKKGLEDGILLWGESDPGNRNELGQTISGLFWYFKPAFYGYRGKDADGVPFIDEFGYSDIKRAKAHLEKKRTNLLGASLASEKHKYPFTAQEAFIMAGDECPFDTDRIYTQIDYNTTMPESTVRQGNFRWKIKGREVEFVDSAQGRWKVVWMPPKELRNNIIIKKGRQAPGNTAILCSGVDPYDHSITTDGRRSMAASYVRRKFDPMEPHNSKLFACQYIARPQKVEHFYEDMLMQCFFYGTDILSENNKIGLINYFKTKGMDRFLMARPEPTHTPHSKKQKEFGIPMTGDEARDALVSAIETEIVDNVGYLEEHDRYAKCYFDELLLDWAKFDIDNWTPYDPTVASGLALLAERKYIRKKKPPPEDDVKWINEYKIKGNTTKLVD